MTPAADTVTLTKTQERALLAIDAFRNHFDKRNSWKIGGGEYSRATVEKLADAGLIRISLGLRQPRLSLTKQGQLAVLKIKGMVLL